MNPGIDPHISIQVRKSNKFLLPNREEPDAEQYGCETLPQNLVKVDEFRLPNPRKTSDQQDTSALRKG